jgi:hypothetical protein
MQRYGRLVTHGLEAVLIPLEGSGPGCRPPHSVAIGEPWIETVDSPIDSDSKASTKVGFLDSVSTSLNHQSRPKHIRHKTRELLRGHGPR